MTLSFLRIDDRIIHGQVIVRWSKEFPCDGILAVNDRAATDPLLKNALKSASDKRALIYTLDEFVLKLPEAVASPKRYFLITKDPQTMLALASQPGFAAEVNTINVGPQSAREGTVHIGNNADATRDELAAYASLADLGWEISFQLTPDAKRTSWASVAPTITER